MKKLLITLSIILSGIFTASGSWAYDVVISNQTVAPDETTTVALRFDNNSSQIQAYQTTLTYDESILTLVSVEKGDSFASDEFNLAVNTNSPGKVTAGVFSTELGIPDAAGEILVMEFVVSDTAPSQAEAEIFIQDFLMGNIFEQQAPESKTHGRIIVENDLAPQIVINPGGNKTVAEGSTLEFTVTASNVDGTVLASNLEEWMSFNAVSGKFRLEPQVCDGGLYEVEFSAGNNSGTAVESIQIFVKGDDCSKITLQSIGDKTVHEMKKLSFIVRASTLKGSIGSSRLLNSDASPIPVRARGLESWMNFDGRTFEATPDDGDEGNYQVTFTAGLCKTALGDCPQETINIKVTEFFKKLDIDPADEGGKKKIQKLISSTDGLSQDPNARLTQSVVDYLWFDHLTAESQMPENYRVYLDKYLTHYLKDKELTLREAYITIRRFSPPQNPYGYGWALLNDETAAQYLETLAVTLASEVETIEGYSSNMPAVIPLYGDYARWSMVNGVRTTSDPVESPTFGIHGVWITNPSTSGFGAISYVTAQQFLKQYALLSNDTGSQTLSDESYHLIGNASAVGGVGSVKELDPVFNRAVPVRQNWQYVVAANKKIKVGIKGYHRSYARLITKAAIKSVTDEVAFYDNQFSSAFDQTIAQQPVLVEAQSGNYFLVPFIKLQDDGSQGETVLVAVIDAVTGTLREVSRAVNDEGVQGYLSLTPAQALEAISREHYGINLSGARIALRHENENVYQPVYEVRLRDGQVFYVDQNSRVNSPDGEY